MLLNQNLTLTDGRNISYNLYGDIQGKPLFVFHGTPGSRVWYEEDDLTAKELDICLIAPDRPGYGLSTFQPNRTISNYAKDIQELAQHLNFRTFSCLGVSGGGPFALAVAEHLPTVVENCILVSSATPFENGKAPKTMSQNNRLAFFLTNKLPLLMKYSLKSQKKLIDTNKDKYFELLLKSAESLPAWDKTQLLKDGAITATYLHAKEAFHLGIEGTMYETQLLSKDWDIKIENINIPVHIWHGKQDSHSPLVEMEKLLPQFKNATFHLIAEGGHFLCDDDTVWKEILSTI